MLSCESKVARLIIGFALPATSRVNQVKLRLVNRTDRTLNDIDLVLDALQRLRRDLPELVRRNRYPARDGYPSGSMNGPGQRGAISKPTEQAALSKPPNDPVARALKDILRLWDDTSRAMASIDDLRHSAMNMGPSQPKAEACKNCSQPALPRSRQGRCFACYQYRRRNGKERPIPKAS